MHEDSKQMISRLLDNDLDRNEAFSLLEAVRTSPDLQNTLKRYEAISYALKTEKFLMPEMDFAAKVNEKIRQEPTYLLPESRVATNRRYKIYAAAASIALIGIITGLQVKPAADFAESPVAAGQPLQIAIATPLSSSAQPVRQDPINKQINDYLQAHNSSVYTNGQAHFQPYARITAYSNR